MFRKYFWKKACVSLLRAIFNIKPIIIAIHLKLGLAQFYILMEM